MVSTTSATRPATRRVVAGRVLAVAVGGEALGEIEARRAAGDRRRGPRRATTAPTTWDDDVGQESCCREAPARRQPDGDRRVQVAAGDVADGIGHGEHGQAEGERHAEKADADIGEAPPRGRRCRNLRR